MSRSPLPKTLWFIVIVQFVMSAAFSTSIPFLPLFLAELHAGSTAQIYMLSAAAIGVTFLCAAALSPIWGILADRLGRKAMVVRSCVAVCIFTCTMGFAQNAWELILARAAMGLFSGFFPASTALAATSVPDESLGYSLGWMASAQLCGSLVGPLIGGVLVGWFHDYREVFFGTATLSLAAALACLVLVDEQHRTHRNAAQPQSKPWEARDLSSLLPLISVMLLAQVAVFAAQPVIGIFVRTLVGQTPWLGLEIGLSFAVTGVADLICSPFLGKRSDRIGYRAVLLTSLIGMAVFTLPQAFATTFTAFIVLRFAAGAFLGGILPTADAWFGRHFSTVNRGKAYGIAGSANLFGMFLGPVLGGAVASYFGGQAVFVLSATCGVAAVGVVLLSRLSARSEPAPIAMVAVDSADA